MNWINGILTTIGDVLLKPMTSWSPAAVLVVVSVVAGILMTVTFRYTSNQAALRRVASVSKAQLMCLRIFKEDLGVALRCQRDILRSIGRRLWLSLPPMAVLIVPFVLILTQLALRYEKRPIGPGESVVLAVELSPGQWQSHGSDVSLQVPDGVVLESPALRDAGDHTVYWRLGLGRSVTGPLILRTGYHTVEKSFVGTDDTDRLCTVSARRPGSGFFDRLLYPGEPGLARDAPVRSVHVRYPDRSTPFFGVNIPWWGTFFIVSMLAAILVRPFLKVQF